MTLVIENPTDVFTAWAGERINGVQWPPSIEQLWDSDQLAEIGLIKPADLPAAPDGQHYVGAPEVRRVDGIVQWVGTLTDDPLPDLLPFQFFSMLALSGKESQLDAFIAGLPEPNKTIATNKLNRSLSFQRDNELVLAAQQALGLTTQQLDGLWLQAAAIT